MAFAMMAAGIVSLARGGSPDQKRLRRRMAALSAPRGSANVARVVALSKVAPEQGALTRVLGGMAGVLGYDPAVPDRPVPIWVACLLSLLLARAGVWLATAMLGGWGWLAFPVLALFLLRSYFVWCQRRWQTALFKQFPDALSSIVRTVRVGVSMPEGIRRVADEAAEPTATIFKRIADELAIGTSLSDAMATSASETGLPEYRFFTTALTLQSRTGGGLAATLDGLADVIRKRVAVKARGKALASEARASTMILALMPVVTALGMLVMNPDYIWDLFVEPKGHTILAMACATEGFGLLVMKIMINKALS